MSGAYFTHASPVTLPGLMIQSETRVRVGTSRFWASMEVTSAAYLARTASIGLQAGQCFDLGELSAIGFEHVPSFAQPDVKNVLHTSLQTLESEETKVTMSVYQFDPRLLEIAVGTGIMYTLGNERQITVGGKCNTSRVPIEISSINIGCNAPAAAQSVLVGIQGIVVTVYDCSCTSGLPWSDIVAGELNSLELEWTAYRVPELAAGAQVFNIYIY